MPRGHHAATLVKPIKSFGLLYVVSEFVPAVMMFVSKTTLVGFLILNLVFDKHLGY